VRKFLAVVTGLAVFGGSLLFAQSTNASSDNPLAGLKLDDANANDPSSNPNGPSAFLAKFNSHLVVLSDGHFKLADRALLNGVKYVAFYYSASWCPPCRAFTPKLVDFYHSFKKTHPNFELIFVNDDQDSDDMLAYMVKDQMQWPAVRFDDIDSDRIHAKQFQGSGIPDLVLVDDTGKVLADSFVNGGYVGPEQVMDQIQQMVPAPQGSTATAGP
jgi:nucleoredoxin